TNNDPLPVTNTPVQQANNQPPTMQPPTIPATFTPEPTASPRPTQRFYEPLEMTPAGTAVPPPRPPFPKGDNITNIVLLGNDVAQVAGGRTDSIIIVSINRDTQTAAMLSLPRDLYVYIPGWQMTKINLALPHGHGVEYANGSGGGLIKDTIEYNLGIPIDYYARIGFDGFKTAVDTLGGIEIINTCKLRDWRLISPELDQTVEENWEQFILEPGIYEMDGDFALWYARSRRTTNDFERGRRQQQVLRAIFDKGLDSNTLTQIPELWRTYRQTVETDLTLPVILELAALAPAVGENGIQHYAIAGNAVSSWSEPETGWSMQLLNWENAEPILRQVMVPPQLNRGKRASLVVEIVTDDDSLYRLMAENLAWFGFTPRFVPIEAETKAPTKTSITYYGSNFKGSYNWLLSWIFHQDPSAIALEDAGDGEFYYRVVLGQDVDPCLEMLNAPNGD
ncbi:MAG: LCP family protein, partial [Anaerolineae bacterium]|nr:LCP family protein [Anaerolineae bacterium]